MTVVPGLTSGPDSVDHHFFAGFGVLLLAAKGTRVMAEPSEPESTTQPDDLERQADEFERQADEPQAGLVGEFLYFLVHNKKWWLTPIILVLLLLGVLIVLGGTGAAPFIYTLF